MRWRTLGQDLMGVNGLLCISLEVTLFDVVWFPLIYVIDWM